MSPYWLLLIIPAAFCLSFLFAMVLAYVVYVDKVNDMERAAREAVKEAFVQGAKAQAEGQGVHAVELEAVADRILHG